MASPSKKRVVVAGAGFVGHQIVSKLEAQGVGKIELTLIDRRSYAAGDLVSP